MFVPLLGVECERHLLQELERVQKEDVVCGKEEMELFGGIEEPQRICLLCIMCWVVSADTRRGHCLLLIRPYSHSLFSISKEQYRARPNRDSAIGTRASTEWNQAYSIAEHSQIGESIHPSNPQPLESRM